MPADPTASCKVPVQLQRHITLNVVPIKSEFFKLAFFSKLAYEAGIVELNSFEFSHIDARSFRAPSLESCAARLPQC